MDKRMGTRGRLERGRGWSTEQGWHPEDAWRDQVETARSQTAGRLAPCGGFGWACPSSEGISLSGIPGLPAPLSPTRPQHPEWHSQDLRTNSFSKTSSVCFNFQPRVS